MEIPKELPGVLAQNPRVMSGAVCFAGTRIPVQILLDNLRAGVSIDEFLDAYPDLTREQIHTVIYWEDRQARPGLGLAQKIRGRGPKGPRPTHFRSSFRFRRPFSAGPDASTRPPLARETRDAHEWGGS